MLLMSKLDEHTFTISVSDTGTYVKLQNLLRYLTDAIKEKCAQFDTTVDPVALNVAINSFSIHESSLNIQT